MFFCLLVAFRTVEAMILSTPSHWKTQSSSSTLIAKPSSSFTFLYILMITGPVIRAAEHLLCNICTLWGVMKELALWLLPSFSVCKNKSEATCAMKPCGHKDPYSTVQYNYTIINSWHTKLWLVTQTGRLNWVSHLQWTYSIIHNHRCLWALITEGHTWQTRYNQVLCVVDKLLFTSEQHQNSACICSLSG